MTEIGRLPTEALEAAARAAERAFESWRTSLRWQNTPEQRRRDRLDHWIATIAAAAPHLIAEGRRQAAEAIRAADTAEWGPKRWLVPDVRDCQESAARIAEGTSRG